MRTVSRSAITLAASALALGLLAPTVASATSIEGYSSDVQQAAVAEITSTEGITPAAAEEILRVQSDSVETLNGVLDQLGDQQAGGYLDDSGMPVVNVLDEATAAELAPSGVAARVVDHSAAELRSAREALEAVPAVAHTAIAVDPETNQVVLTVAEEADDAAAADLLAAAARFGDAVRVEHVTGGLHKAIYGGEAITGGGSRCSAGFNVNSGGQLYIVDAGHCTGAVSQWNVGPSVAASFPGNDYGLIRNDTGSGPGAVTLWDGSAQAINSASNATVGQRICKSGSTTGLTCGVVQATNVTVNYSQGAVHQLIQTSASVNSGDSGGSLFAGSTALGITSGMGGGSSFFQPVVEALNAYGVSLN
ncbi:Alpha-lytic protease proenzyme [Saccharomonospora marina XMU15]|uniref:Alpha-lytic protease proenzyme n=1 Tax=Saccharomonospora marina XMU15 TaxID=882083 RepID=H5X668_9PSEU|nr:S1 family peptidase [Saccharomonospora marina]EHR48953.1 Alpha-lytic protease proenzyme [Saccharomonospora marina XMU15]